jgi:hypothetical protein
LSANGVPFDPNPVVRGITGFEHGFDFVFKLPKKLPYFIRGVANPADKVTFEAFMYAATDVDRTGMSSDIRI